jgi:ABC-2 type transport system ATP-binding protein
MIQIDNLFKANGEKQALRGISFTAQPGEILGFLGPNGAGKSTTVKILTGLLQPDGGSAQVANFDVVREPIDAKRRIGYVPETGAIYESLTAYEYLELVANLQKLAPEVYRKRIDEFLDLFGLADEAQNQIAGFSKGMRQKILISAALLHNPPVLLFDEPLNGIDANSAMVFKELLRKLSQQGKTILFCSHILEVVERLCTRLVIIDKGRLVAEGTTEAIARQTKASSLEQAFSQLTGVRDATAHAEEFMQVLQGLQPSI